MSSQLLVRHFLMALMLFKNVVWGSLTAFGRNSLFGVLQAKLHKIRIKTLGGRKWLQGPQDVRVCYTEAVGGSRAPVQAGYLTTVGQSA